jgi:pyruvate formate lyase activating enzyme
MSVAEVMAEILRDRLFYEESAGGVTFSGGEPLLQPAFLLALLDECRTRDLHTAVDTCGFGCTDHLLSAASRARLILYDLKLMDDTRHRQHTGVPSRPILENLRRLDQTQARVWVRVPLIPGVNDDDENLSAMARFVASLRRVQQVNVLPYHATGMQKWGRLGRASRLDDVEAPSRDHLERAAGWFREAGLKTVIGG